jgi:V/A-type H+-transporting ATPase subunit D
MAPTRSRLMELRRERRFVAEGRELLDQKRLLIAGEALRCLAELEAERARLFERDRAARDALADAVGQHGVLELSVRPVATSTFRLDVAERRFLGIPLVRAELSSRDGPAPELVNPSPEATRCRWRYAEVVVAAARVAALERSIDALRAEYRRTHRRVRALDNVVLPELDHAIRAVEDQLDAQDREELLRARMARSVGG